MRKYRAFFALQNWILLNSSLYVLTVLNVKEQHFLQEKRTFFCLFFRVSLAAYFEIKRARSEIFTDDRVTKAASIDERKSKKECGAFILQRFQVAQLLEF